MTTPHTPHDVRPADTRRGSRDRDLMRKIEAIVGWVPIDGIETASPLADTAAPRASRRALATTARTAEPV